MKWITVCVLSSKSLMLLPPKQTSFHNTQKYDGTLNSNFKLCQESRSSLRRPPVTHVGTALRTVASQGERKTKFMEVNTWIICLDSYYGLNVMSPQNSYLEILIPNVIVLESGTFLGVTRSSRCSLHELVLLKKRAQRAFSRVSAMWVHSKKIAVHETRSEFSPDTNLPVSWSWLPSLQNHEKLILAVYMPRSIWYCIYSTLNGLRQLSIILSEEFGNLFAHPLQNFC